MPATTPAFTEATLPVCPPAAALCLARAEACRATSDARGEAAALFEAQVRGGPATLIAARLASILRELGLDQSRACQATESPFELASALTATETWSALGYRAVRERVDLPGMARGGWGLPLGASLSHRRSYAAVLAAILWAGPVLAFLLGRHMTSFAELRFLPWPLALGLSIAFIPALAVLAVVIASGIRRLSRSIAACSQLRRGRVQVEAKARRVQFRWVDAERLFRSSELLHTVLVSYRKPAGGPQAVTLFAPAPLWEKLRVGQVVSVWYLDHACERPAWTWTHFHTEWNLDPRRGPVAIPLVGFALIAAFTGLFGAVVVAVLQALL
ncbi:MAG: hypothetical protein AB1486_02635 [Planctomycetota bacterium]